MAIEMQTITCPHCRTPHELDVLQTSRAEALYLNDTFNLCIECEVCSLGYIVEFKCEKIVQEISVNYRQDNLTPTDLKYLKKWNNWVTTE